MLRIRERINTWPGFVDLFSNLVIILIFLLIVFVFLWTTTNVFNHAGGGKKVVELRRENAVLTGQLQEKASDEAEARNLLLMARDALTNLEQNQENLQQDLEALVDENSELGQMIDSKNDMLEKLIGDYERALRESQGESVRMMAVVHELTAQLRALEQQEDIANSELELQKQSLMAELSRMNELLAESESRAAEKEVYYVELSGRLNKALADKVAELNALQDKKSAMAEYQSEFFKAIRGALSDVRGVDVSSDRFLIPSDILFGSGSFSISPEGQRQLRLIAGVIMELEEKIPTDISWIIRVDGHTDKKPVIPGTTAFRNNTQLSLLRATAVVRELVNAGVSRRRLVPSGFGELHPLELGNGPAELQRNRRIELRLTNP